EHDVVHAVPKGAHHAALLLIYPRGKKSEEQRKEDQPEHLALGGVLDDVLRHEPEEDLNDVLARSALHLLGHGGDVPRHAAPILAANAAEPAAVDQVHDGQATKHAEQ